MHTRVLCGVTSSDFARLLKEDSTYSVVGLYPIPPPTQYDGIAFMCPNECLRSRHARWHSQPALMACMHAAGQTPAQRQWQRQQQQLGQASRRQ
jgi:hypothetical protein